MKLILIAFTLTLLLFISGCSSEEVPLKSDPVDSISSSENSLANTCSKGKACNYPSCGQWVDENNDGKCDRSIE